VELPHNIIGSNLPGNLPGAAVPEPNTSELMRPEGQANWLVHEIAHLHLSHLVETVLESIHSGTINSTLLQSIPPVNNPLRKDKQEKTSKNKFTSDVQFLKVFLC